MSTLLKRVTAISIVAFTLTGALAYSVHHGFSSVWIAMPDESTRMLLIPIPLMAERPGDIVCCKHADRP